MSEKWWWRKEVWQRLSSTRTKPKNQKRKVVRLSYHP
jgi:hypothetical protein